MAGPSIKGIAITQLVADVGRLRDEERLSAEELEARLAPPALAMLDQKIRPTAWYPIEAYESLVDLLWEIEGRRDPQYLRERGAASAERLLAAGLYQQIDYLTKRYRPADMEEFEQGLKLIVTLQGAILDFGRWSVEPDPDHPNRLQIVVDDAACFPESLCHTTAGFMTHLGAKARDHGLQWFHERPSPDRVRLRMDRPASFTRD